MKKYKWAVATKSMGRVEVFCKSKKKATNYVHHNKDLYFEKLNMHKRAIAIDYPVIRRPLEIGFK